MIYITKLNDSLNEGARMINEVNELIQRGDPRSIKRAEKIRRKIGRIKNVGMDYMIHRAATMRRV